MSVFILETDAVTAAADSLSSIGSSLENLSNTVNGYDTSQSSEDSFDFDGAKSVIAENIKAASIKVQNTQTIMNSVVDSHTKLQKSLTTDESDSSKKTKSGNSGNNNSGGYYSSGGGYSSGTAGIAGATAASVKNKEKEKSKDKDKDKDKVKITDVKNKINKVSYVYPNINKFSEESKNIFNDIEYDKDGYAKLNNYYVISADKDVGNVGDIIKFTKEDGTTETLIIGVNTVSDKYKNTISFIVNEDKVSEFKPLELGNSLLKNNSKIENCGNYKIYEENQKLVSATNKDNNSNTSLTTENLEESVNSQITENLEDSVNSQVIENNINDNESGIPNTDTTESEVK